MVDWSFIRQVVIVVATVFACFIALTVYVVIMIRLTRRHWTDLDQKVGALLKKRGWERTPEFPQTALNVFDGDEFLMAAAGYSHAYQSSHRCGGDRAIHFGIVTPGGSNSRTVSAGATIVATEAIRAPLTCMIAAEHRPTVIREQFFSAIRVGGEKGRLLCVHIDGRHSEDEPSVAETLRIAERTFDAAPQMVSGDVRALLGPTGMLISGPSFGLKGFDGALIEPFIAQAELFIGHDPASPNIDLNLTPPPHA